MIKYRVVEATWVGGKRVEKEIVCKDSPLAKAKEEMKDLQKKQPEKLYSLKKI